MAMIFVPCDHCPAFVLYSTVSQTQSPLGDGAARRTLNSLPPLRLNTLPTLCGQASSSAASRSSLSWRTSAWAAASSLLMSAIVLISNHLLDHVDSNGMHGPEPQLGVLQRRDVDAPLFLIVASHP